MHDNLLSKIYFVLTSVQMIKLELLGLEILYNLISPNATMSVCLSVYLSVCDQGILFNRSIDHVRIQVTYN